MIGHSRSLETAFEGNNLDGPRQQSGWVPQTRTQSSETPNRRCRRGSGSGVCALLAHTLLSHGEEPYANGKEAGHPPLGVGRSQQSCSLAYLALCLSRQFARSRRNRLSYEIHFFCEPRSHAHDNKQIFEPEFTAPLFKRSKVRAPEVSDREARATQSMEDAVR